LDGRRKALDIDEKVKIAGYFNGLYALSGKIKCALCGSPYYHNSYSNRNKVKTNVWSCAKYKSYGKSHPSGCANISVKSVDMDYIVKKIAFDFWNNKQETLANVIEVLKLAISDDAVADKTASLLDKKNKIAKKKDKLLELYYDELINKDDFRVRNEKLSDELLSIENELLIASKQTVGSQSRQERLNSISAFLDTQYSTEDGITDGFIKVLVDGIIVHPDRTIDLTIGGATYDKLSVKKTAEEFPNVSDVRPHRHPSRSHPGRIRRPFPKNPRRRALRHSKAPCRRSSQNPGRPLCQNRRKHTI